ncbi:hypothetical protein K470DRAFT_281001 [Piedraia hortae CBS 480.64]|uniref:Dihydrofolate reductase n=1 Tax=Piedraia hortae CBS 480.64 TaxID=1314780 RepID=A0A6A7C5C9_9PEZI|nr:hypothetical protein K470DRAFT_281001 [Piedraia hortae CBS 480.64]
MSLKHTPLTIIVAATPKNGIGHGGKLPWPMLKNEMAYFARVTKRVPKVNDNCQSDAGAAATFGALRQNIVIMGRKTWDSIPSKFRPLKDRTNVVISTQSRSDLESIPEDVVVAPDIMTALQSLESLINAGRAPHAGRAFVIGGAKVYAAALQLPQTKNILMTRLETDFDCDIIFPDDLNAIGSGWCKKNPEDLQQFVEENITPGPLTEAAGDRVVTYRFCLYQRG